MIYRILVDNRDHVTTIGPSFVMTRHSLKALSGGSDPALPSRLAPLKDKVFPNYESFIVALFKILGRARLALHKPLILHVASHSPLDEARTAIPWRDQKDRRLGGPGYGWLADVMEERGLRSPLTTNSRLRYYFTELGWRTVGRHVAAEARRLGQLVRVVRQKNPNASQIVYRDDLQIAILQHKGSSRNSDTAIR